MNENRPLQRTRRIPRKVIYRAAGVLIGIFVLMQFGRFVVPDFRLDNPPVTHTITWNSPESERLWNQACADCHSNETRYPWYTYIAPVGWLVAYDVHAGRDALNISDSARIELDEMIEVIQEGEMPPSIYTAMHRDANLSAADQQVLIDGIRTSFAGVADSDSDSDEEEDDD